METDPEVARKMEDRIRRLGWGIDTVAVTEFRMFWKVEEGRGVLDRCGTPTREPHRHRGDAKRSPLGGLRCGLDGTEEKMGPCEDGAVEMLQQETEQRWTDTTSRGDKAVSGDPICGSL